MKNYFKNFVICTYSSINFTLVISYMIKSENTHCMCDKRMDEHTYLHILNLRKKTFYIHEINNKSKENNNLDNDLFIVSYLFE